ncbi:helix-turn-helix domain-containing protein [Streptomyces canus]|uniref:helix-turn-helix transcriptional regulator n=1 Tax=Streptomyces canus TaxID=58343 RepID=UPI00037B05F9|nr:helix-turn-helix domain-containing protein [Streptomyces canus]
MDGVAEPYAGWTFLINHARVLAAVAEDDTTRIRDVAVRCRLTERAVQRIIADLEAGGYLTHIRQGRSNLYRVSADTVLRHPADGEATVAGLLALMARHDRVGTAAPAHAEPDSRR